MRFDRPTLDSLEIPSFDRNRNLGPFQWIYRRHIQLEPVEPASVPMWLSLSVGLAAYKGRG